MWKKLDRDAKGILVVICVAAVYRLLFVGMFPLGPDESFYWDWSRHLDLSYVEHPPMVAYAIALMTSIFGDTWWATRLLTVPIAGVCSWLLFCTGRRLFDSRVGFWAGTFHAACPMFSMAGGIMLLPESLLTLWMTLALYVASRLITSGNMRLFYLLGVLLGGALLSKYPGILILAGLGLFAICSPKHRHWFLRKEPYVMVLIGLVLFSPVIVWNVQHDWAGVGFVNKRTQLEDSGFVVARMWQSLMGQAGYHSPVVFVILWFGVAVAGYRGFSKGDDRSLLLFCFSGPVIVLFLVVSGFRHTLPHWPAAGYLAAYVAGPAAMFAGRDIAAAAFKKWRKWLMVAAASIGAAESVLMPVVMVYPLTTMFYDRLQPVLGLPPDPIEPMAEATGWDGEIRDRIIDIRRRVAEQTGEEPVVLTHNHMLAGLLAYGLRDVCPVISIHATAHQYNMWFSDEDVVGRPVIFVSSDNSDLFRGKPDDFYMFDECVAEPVMEIVRHDVKINEVNIWVCEGYRGPVE